MIISRLKEFGKSPLNVSLTEVIRYLSTDMVQNLTDIGNALRKLAFADNFESFEFTGTIPGDTELAIRNSFRGGLIPSKRIIVRGNKTSVNIADGPTDWTRDFIYLKNYHATDEATFTAVFFK